MPSPAAGATWGPEGRPAAAAAALAPPPAEGFSVLNEMSEAINGRGAMLGVLFAIGAELATGQSVWSQLFGVLVDDEYVEKGHALSDIGFFAVVVITTMASLYPRLLAEEKPDARSFGPFTPAAEALNGRAAMLGFLALLVVEGKMGHALF